MRTRFPGSRIDETGAIRRMPSVRSRLATALAQEILEKSGPEPFLLSSEHQLCAKYNVSRVTVRLALGDLENRGLIYRKQGKGTFAHARNSRPTKMVALLLKSSFKLEHWPISEMIRGVQNVLSPHRVSMAIINTSPAEWSVETASNLAGVIVFPLEITQQDLDNLKERKLPFVLAGEAPTLSGPQVRLGQVEASRRSVEKLLQLGHRRIALLSGYESNFDATKRLGVHQALRDARIDPCLVPEFSASLREDGAEGAVRSILHLRPLPTVVVAFDDCLASLLCVRARQEMGLKVPSDLSVVSLHYSPYLRFLEPALTTLQFDFVGVGRLAAEVLHRAVLTGEVIEDSSVKAIYHDGQTVGPVARREEPALPDGEHADK